MATRCLLDGYPWDHVVAARRFITGLFEGPAPDRPGALLHFPGPDAAALSRAPADLSPCQQSVWSAVQGLRHRPVGRDDFVPALGTGAGTGALATAFGCAETRAGGLYWVKPAVGRAEDIDRLRKPLVTAGRLGEVLEQTRAFAAQADPRIAVRIMDFQSPFTTCEQILGSELFFTLPYDHARRLHALMDLVTDFSIEFFQAQLAAAGPAACPGSWPPIWFPRIAGIQMSDDNMVNVSPAVYDEFVIPYNNRIAAAFGGLFLHACTIREENLPSLHKLKRLTGVNCDISTSVTTGRLLMEFGDRAVVAPHAYINTNTGFRSYGEFTAAVLRDWHPGQRLFIYPCVVLYQPAESREIPFNRGEVESALRQIPAWRRDHPDA